MLVDPHLVPPPRAGREASRRRRLRIAPVSARDDMLHGSAPATRLGALPRQAPVLLIVDDDPLMTNLLPRTLHNGYACALEIVCATTPEEAARLIRAMRPDIVLSDYNLRAAKTGLDVLVDAAEVVPAGVRILFSGHTQAEIGPAVQQAPIHGFIEKPFRLDELLEPIARLVQQASGVDLTRAPVEDR